MKKYFLFILYVFSTCILYCQISNDNNFSAEFNVRGLNEWEQLLAKHCPKIGLDPLKLNTLTNKLYICSIHIYDHILNHNDGAIGVYMKNNRIDSLITKSYFYSSNGQLDSIYLKYSHWNIPPEPSVDHKLFFNYSSDSLAIVNKIEWKRVMHDSYLPVQSRYPRTLLNSNYEYWDFGRPRKCINFLSKYFDDREIYLSQEILNFDENCLLQSIELYQDDKLIHKLSFHYFKCF